MKESVIVYFQSPKHGQDERAPRVEGPEKSATEEPAPHNRPEGEVEV